MMRGKATGTPAGEFFGVKPTGKSFNTMALDLFTVKNGNRHPPIMLKTGWEHCGRVAISTEGRLRGHLWPRQISKSHKAPNERMQARCDYCSG